jgi:CrcB protein
MNILLVAIGGALGAVIRFWISQATTGRQLPIGTLFVNLGGSFILGWIIGTNTTEWMLALVGIGFCGALTTFSTVQWEIFQLHQQQTTHLSIVYLLLTYIGGLMVTTMGYWFGLQH